MEKSVGLCDISLPSIAGRCFDIAFSKSLTEVASVAPSGTVKLDLDISRSIGDIAAAGFDEDFRLASSSLSLVSSSSIVCFRFLSLRAGIGDVFSVVV